jgi:Protein of unknown function (DUF3662)/FHA domain
VGVLGRFEKGIERAVNGVFARAFRSEVQPVELASALKREADDNASVVGRNRTIAPNDYVIELGTADHRRLGQWEDALGDELATVLNDHALQQRYAFVGPVHVRFEHAEDLDTGVFRVRSKTSRDADPAGSEADSHRDRGAAVAYPGAPAYPQPGYAQPAYPQPAYPQPGYAQPGFEQPGFEQPGFEQPGHEQPWARPAAPEYPPPAAYPAPAPSAYRPPAPVLELDGRAIPLTRAVTVVGRSGDVDIPLDDAGVSRRHAEIHVADGRARVVDLGSTNGTFVDGERVTTADLHDGSTITVGRSRFTFRLGQR